ncbi:MAG: hypothetical protein PHI85_11305 [Victivallaceae bacterium]|nr:hypothetical protein [Victivallaceae bacterium]
MERFDRRIFNFDASDGPVLADAAGLLVAPGETIDEFRSRLERLFAWRRDFLGALKRDGRAAVAPGLTVRADSAVDDGVFAEAAEVTERLYGFAVNWVPGFYLTEPLGFFWGGCSWTDPADGQAVFTLRSAFQRRSRWLWYDRTELAAHELCHIAHAPVSDPSLEEFFAYRSGRGRLRRVLGNCFVHDWDALIFMVPSLLLFCAQLGVAMGWWSVAMWPFWLLTFGGPGYLLLRSEHAVNRWRRARRRLLAAGVGSPDPVLFRLTAAEIRELSALPEAEVASWLNTPRDLRFEVLRKRFVPAGGGENE